MYHTADASLWFFHAIERSLVRTDDRHTLRLLLPTLLDIVAHHERGTRFGIGVDPADGLLRQGAEGYQLTWMDAKVGDWVVTPRTGNAVEINALWYNALCALAGFAERLDRASAPWRQAAERVAQGFDRFWNEPLACCFDVIDGPDGADAALRPNQIFAVSLRHAVLDRSRWRNVLNTVQERLLTPMGPRTLAPGHPDYKPVYSGDLRARDAAYHQGTVWPWLLGPFVDAWLKTYPQRRDEARAMVRDLYEHLGEAGIGTLSEVFDAEEPFTARGCIAQAWSVAELIRATASVAKPERAVSHRTGSPGRW